MPVIALFSGQRLPAEKDPHLLDEQLLIVLPDLRQYMVLRVTPFCFWSSSQYVLSSVSSHIDTAFPLSTSPRALPLMLDAYCSRFRTIEKPYNGKGLGNKASTTYPRILNDAPTTNSVCL